jgi:hypothetical protein
VNEFVVSCLYCGEEVATHLEEDVRGSFVQDCASSTRISRTMFAPTPSFNEKTCWTNTPIAAPT